MAYNTNTPINLSNYNKPKKKKVFGVKEKKRKDKERPGRQAGVATAIAGSLYFGLNPLAKALGFGSPVKMEECSVDLGAGSQSAFGASPKPGTKRYQRWAWRQGRKGRKSCNTKRTKSHLFGL